MSADCYQQASILDPIKLKRDEESTSTTNEHALDKVVLSIEESSSETTRSSSPTTSCREGSVGKEANENCCRKADFSTNPDSAFPVDVVPSVHKSQADPVFPATVSLKEETAKHPTSNPETTKNDSIVTKIMSSRSVVEQRPTFQHVMSTDMSAERPMVINSSATTRSTSDSSGELGDELITSSSLQKKIQPDPDDFSDPLVTKHRLQRFMHKCTQPYRDALREGYELAVSGSFHENNKSPGQQTFLLLSGSSGSGKRAVAEAALRKLVQEQDGGYYLQGHYDSLKRPVPYSGLVMAFDSFTSQVRQRGPEAAATMRNSIYSCLGSCADVSVLTGMIPSLHGILGCDGVGSDHKKRTAMVDDPVQRFVTAFRMFMRGVTQNQPLVLVMHDLHFADFCSLDILTSIATDLQGRGLCLLGTCDDSLVTADSYLSKKLRELEDSGVRIKNVSLQIPWVNPSDSCDELQILLSKVLSIDADEDKSRTAARLARLIQSQTDTKSWFLIKEYVQWLQEAGLLCYRRWSDGKWRWELSSPEKLDVFLGSRNKTDRNSFLVDKLDQQLLDESKEVLKVCSCLGTNINPEFLEYILGDSSQKSLENLFDQGFIACRRSHNIRSACDNVCYIFEDEEMRQAAYRLVPDPELFHLEIGRRLWRKFSSEQLEENIFVVLSQMYMGRRLITREKERIAIANLCLHAGKKAARASTFRIATTYLEMGIDLLLYSEENGKDDPIKSRCWRDEYELTLALHCAVAEMTMCCARFEDTHAALEPVFQNARTFDDKLQAYTTKMYTHSQQDERQKCLDLGIYVLEQLGEAFPTRMCNARLLKELASVGKLLKNKTDEQICRMPHISDMRKLNALQVLNFMVLPALTHRPKLSPFVLLKMTKITLLHGLSALASAAFATYGMLCVGLTCDIEKGSRFGDLGLKLLDQFGLTQYIPRVYAAVYGCVHAWTKPISGALPPLLQAYQVGMSNGDPEFGGLCGNLYCFFALDSGVNLDAICHMYKGVKESLVTARQAYILRMFFPTIQIIHHFMGLTPDPLAANGDLMDFDEYQKALEKHSLASIDLKFCRLILTVVFGDIANAEKFVITDDEIALTPPSYERVSIIFYSGLVFTALARTERGVKYLRYLMKAKKALGRMKWLGRSSPVNGLDKSHLLQAEVASLLGQNAKAIDNYFCAIALAGEKDHLFMHALSNELLARHHLRQYRRNNDNKAVIYLERAIESYKKWGGMAKVKRLQDELRTIYGRSTFELKKCGCLDQACGGCACGASFKSTVPTI